MSLPQLILMDAQCYKAASPTQKPIIQSSTAGRKYKRQNDHHLIVYQRYATEFLATLCISHVPRKPF